MDVVESKRFLPLPLKELVGGRILAKTRNFLNMVDLRLQRTFLFYTWALPTCARRAPPGDLGLVPAGIPEEPTLQTKDRTRARLEEEGEKKGEDKSLLSGTFISHVTVIPLGGSGKERTQSSLYLSREEDTWHGGDEVHPEWFIYYPKSRCK